MKILIVDDNADNVELVTQILEEKYHTISASNGFQCLELAVSEQPDLVLLDVMMPKMDGYEVLQQLLENEETQHIPVIFLTARYKDIDRIVKGLNLGAFDYITKPFEDDILMARVAVALRVKKAEDEIRDNARELRKTNETLRAISSSVSRFTDQVQTFGATGQISTIRPDLLADELKGLATTFQKTLIDREAAERVLKIREKELAQILDNMVNGVIVIDEDGIVQSFNRSSENMFGYHANEVIGQNINMLMTEYDRTHHSEYLHHFLTTGENKIIGKGREVTAKKKTGETFALHISIAELPLSSEGKRRFIGSCLDMTLQKNQEDKIRRTQKMEAMGNLVAGVTHDYNNMLGVIDGFSELLSMGVSDQETVVKYAKQINHAAKRGVGLTKRLLGMSKHKQTENKLLNINTLLEDMSYVLEKTLTSKISFKLDTASDLWNVYLDAGDLEDCILNLSINAMHAMEDGGTLSITTRNITLDRDEAEKLGLDSSEYIQLNISDTGIGMDQETIARIFDPFFSTKVHKGTGLGLSQVYGFVQRSQGSILVDSIPDKGSNFIILLPRSSQTDDLKENGDSILENDLSGNETILVVDDEPSFRQMIEETLKTYGYNVLTANGAQEALAIIDNHSVDAVVSDVIMHEVDGYELAELIREKDKNIPIQLISGYCEQTGSTPFGQALYKKMLRKPVDSRVLLTQLREILTASEKVTPD